MKLFPVASILSIVSIGIQLSAFAYPQVEMQACIKNAVNAVTAKGLNATMKQVKDYCHCSLKGIIDEGRDIGSTLEYCNLKYIYKR